MASKVAKFLRKHKETAVAKRERRVRTNPTTTALTELGETVGVGAGAYVVNRIATKVAKKALGGRFGFLGSHMGPLVSLLTAALIWYLAEKWTWLRRHGSSAVVGNGLAVIQALLERYIPGISNLIFTSTPIALPSASGGVKATGEYIEEENYSLPGQSLSTQLQAITDGENDEDFADQGLNTGVFARN